MEYPRSIWAARATLGAAEAMARLDRASRALEALQRVRLRFPGTPEAVQALDDNTIIYRLFMRPPVQPSYQFSGRYMGAATDKFRDVMGIAIDAAGRVLLGHRRGVAVFDPKGMPARGFSADDPSALFVDEQGRAVVARRGVLVADDGTTVSLGIPAVANEGKPRDIEEISSVVMLSNRDRLIADRKGHAVLRFAPDGKYVGTFSAVDPDRLAVSRRDDVAIIDHDSNGIVITDSDGKQVGRIPARGTGYELDKPIDLTYDRLGHL